MLFEPLSALCVRCAPLSFACEPVLVLTTRKRKAALLLEGKRWSQALRLLDLREWVASGLSLSKKKSQLLRRRTGRVGGGARSRAFLPPRPLPRRQKEKTKHENLVDSASSHTLVPKIKPCMSKYKQLYTVKLRTAH